MPTTTPAAALTHFIALLLICFTSISNAKETLEIIPLKHRPAEMLLAPVTDLAHPDINITASGNQLILRGAAKEITMLRSLIDELDQPLAQYTIHVRQNNQKSHYQKKTQGGYSYHSSNNQNSSSIKIGKTTLDGRPITHNGATIISKSGNHTTTVTSKSYRSSSTSNTSQKISTLEGHSARIETGEEIPFLTWDRYHGSSSRDYKPVITGFYVTPHPSGENRVTLDITTQKQNVKANNRDLIEVAGYQSSINVSLGEWINVGASLQEGSNQNKEIGKRYSVNSGDNYSIEIMVQRAR